MLIALGLSSGITKPWYKAELTKPSKAVWKINWLEFQTAEHLL